MIRKSSPTYVVWNATIMLLLIGPSVIVSTTPQDGVGADKADEPHAYSHAASGDGGKGGGHDGTTEDPGKGKADNAGGVGGKKSILSRGTNIDTTTVASTAAATTVASTAAATTAASTAAATTAASTAAATTVASTAAATTVASTAAAKVSSGAGGNGGGEDDEENEDTDNDATGDGGDTDAGAEESDLNANEQKVTTTPEAASTHFLPYFIACVVVLAIAYLAYHQRAKIFALVVEGRWSFKRKRETRPKGGDYSRLPNTVDEAMHRARGFVY